MRPSRLVASLVALPSATACQVSDPPDLVRVDRLAPARASAGDRLTVTGDGFPAGRAATVTFRGDLHRPGAEPRRDVRLQLSAEPDGRNTLVARLDAETERRFVGSGDAAVHTTFHGDLRVVFQRGVSGLTEVSGTARGVRFDVLPAADERGNDPPAAAPAGLGLDVAPDPAGGLRVGAIDPSGRAALAGVEPGDLITDLGGVTTLSVDDLRVAGGTERARATVERGARRLELDVDTRGLAPLGPSAWRLPATLVLVASALVGLQMTPARRVLGWLGRTVAASRRVTERHAPIAWLSSVGPFDGSRALSAAALLLLVPLGALFARLAAGRSALSPDLDLIAGTLGASIILVISRGVYGARTGGGVSLTHALSASLRTLAFVLPGLLAVVGMVVASGRFVIAEIVGAQGGVPWRWAAMQNPGLLLLAVLLIGSAVPEAREPLELPSAEGSPSRGEGGLAPAVVLVRLAEWTHQWIVCSLVALLFLGGSRVPGVTVSAQELSRPLTLLGAVLLLSKTVGLVVAMGLLRRASHRVVLRHVSGVWARFALPASVSGVVLAAVWATLLETTSSSTLADLTGIVSTATILAAASLGAARLARSQPSTNLAVNPWL